MPTSKRLLLDGIGGLLAWMCIALSLLSIAGCERCSRKAPLAQLAEKLGQVDRDRASAQEEWYPAEIGSAFGIGDAIFTRPGASAVLDLDDGSRLGLEEQTIVRFLEHEPGTSEQRVDLQVGVAFLEAGSSETVLHTTFGQARLEAGARVRLSRAEDALRFEVLVGAASLENTFGQKVDVEVGEAVEVVLGNAELNVQRAPPGPADELERVEGQQVSPEEKAPGELSAEVRGSSVRIRSEAVQPFQPLGPGRSVIAAGSTIEVGAKSSVRVIQGEGHAELAPGGTYVVGGKNGLVEAQSGKLRVSSESPVRIAVPGGFIVTKTGTAIIESVGSSGTRVTASEGELTIRGKTDEVLGGGDSGTLALDGTVAVEGRGPERADVEMRAGQSITIHDPRPPTAIRMLFDDRCERGAVRFSGDKRARPKSSARGRTSASFVIDRGTIAYSLHCLDERGGEGQAAASGKITVLMDAGTRPVPQAAPVTAVEVDGRSYTVLYQNLLPKVSLQWSKAPQASQFTLHASSSRGSRAIATSQPAYTFPSGSLSEGTHTFYFEGGGMVSRKTTVAIVFDNAATTVSLSAAGAPAGAALSLSGMALPGWNVTVDGKPVGQDAEGRFSVHSVMPETGQPAAVVLTHPSRGTHVYLRRPASRAP